ncbi:hypothetical protein SteCoe_19041 [Stentor coeruleus]|uniref:BEACH domain-containing protein n=1 Tax=Stentor coeruleus TaxID=5963 RepID=A0A1R2BV06_9CILI|nr:hypothetical protein SteCoe_19041 [Stentor coeruleus]
MSRPSLPRSLVSNESNDSLDLRLEFYKSTKDQKSFLNFIQCLEQKIINDTGSLMNLPKDAKKRIETTAQELFSSLLSSEMLNELLIYDNYSLLYVYVSILTKDPKMLKRKKSKLLIQSIKNIFPKFYNSLIIQEPDPKLFRNFELLFIRILELLTEKSDDKSGELICSACFSLLDCAYNLHPIYFETFIEDEEISLIKSGSLQENIQEKDLCYYALRTLSRIQAHSKCQNVMKLLGLFHYLANLLLKVNPCENSYLLAIEKLILVFDMLNKVYKNQIKACIQVFELCSQQFLSIFAWVCGKFIEYSHDEPCDDFHKDPKPIGRLFSSVFKLFFELANAETHSQNSDTIEKLCVSLFNQLFTELSNTNTLKFNLANTLQIQYYSIFFLAEFTKSSGKKTDEDKRIAIMKEAGLIDLLLKKELFIIEFIDNSLLSLANSALNYWRVIWDSLCRNRNFTQSLTQGFIDATFNNYSNSEYLKKLISWIPEMQKDPNSFLRDAIKEGLITKFIERVKQTLPSLNDLKSSELIFNLISQLLSLNTLKHIEYPNFLQDIDSKAILENPSYMELVKKILQLNSPINHKHYKELIKKSSDNCALIKYLTVLYEVFKQSSDCKRNFLSCGGLIVLKQKINPEIMKDQNSLVPLWEIVMNCVKSLFLSGFITNRHMEEIDFNTLADFLSSKNLKSITEDISGVCLNPTERILYGTEDLKISNRIIIPQAIPLIFQILTTNSDKESFKIAKERIIHQFHKEIEIPYLAHYNAFDIILKYFSNTNDIEDSDFFEKVLAKVMPFHLPPQGLNKLLSVIKSTINRKKKLILLQAIGQAIFNPDSKKDIITPTNYFYFTDNGYIEHLCPSTSSTSIGKVSILTWIRPSSLKNSVFLQLSRDKVLQISIEINNQKLEVKVGGGKHVANCPLSIDDWNFVCISIRTKKSTLRNKSKVSVCVNDVYEDYPIKPENSKYDGKVFTHMICGNNFDKKLGFEGKMSALFIIYKTFSEIECRDFYKISLQQNLFISSSVLRCEEHKNFKDMKKSLIFEWQPNLKDPIWVYKNTSEDKSLRFNGVSIFESIKINGGIKIFLPLINIEDQSEEEIVTITNIILKIFLSTQSPDIINSEFIQLLGYFLVSVRLFPQLTENVVKIIMSLRDDKLRSSLLKIFLQNESLENLQKTEKIKHINSLLGYIKTSMECDRENLYVVYRHIRNLSIIEIQSLFESYLPIKMNDKSIEAVSYLLVQMNKDKSYDALEALLNIIHTRIEGLVLKDHLEAGIIYLLDQTELHFQKQIIKVISKDMEKLSKLPGENLYEIDRYLKIVQFLDHILPTKNVDPEIIQTIFEVICIEALHKNFKVNLLDIITNRIRYAEPGSDLLFYTSLIEQHINKLQPYIVQSTYFPNWLICTIQNNKNANDLLCLCNSTFFPMDQNLKSVRLKELVKLKELINEIQPSGPLFNNDCFVLRLIKKLTEDYCKSQILLRGDYYSEFIQLLDDLNPELLGTKDFYDIFDLIVNFGINNSLLSFNMSASEQVANKGKANSKEFKENVVLRSGISLMFRALNKSHLKSYVKLLKKIVFKNNLILMPKTDKRLSNEDMLIIEIFYNLSESFYLDENIWLNKFIQKTSVISKIEYLVESFTEQDIKKLIDDKESLKRTQNSIIYDTDDKNNMSLSIESSSSKRKSSMDSISLKELIKETLRPDALYPSQLKHPNWMKFTRSMLHNFFINAKKRSIKQIPLMIEDQQLRSASFSDYGGKIKTFTKIFDSDWLKNFNDTRNLNILHIAKRYKGYLRNMKRQKAILSTERATCFKVRPYFDNKNRYRLTKACKNESLRTSRRLPITWSPEKNFMRSFSMAYFESIIEKSGEISSQLIEENDNEGSEGENVVIEEYETQYDLPANSRIIECERITIKGSYYGSLELHGNHLVYTSEGKTKPEGKYPFSALEFTHQKKECKRIWESNEISEIICRRFMHQHTALEIYLKSGKSYYFNVFTPEIRKELFYSLKKWRNVTIIPVITSKIVKSYTKKWLENKLDNFEYLLALNKLASRSFHDLSQYPVFPWILRDYTSDKLDITDPNVYRNFKWPIGAQDPIRREELHRNYFQFQEDEITPFNYGSHYSSGGVVLHYLVRIEPYSTQARLLQSNTFDVPDRLFISMDNAWKSCTSNNGDVKELVPELFDFPDFLFNTNKNKFGIRQNGQEVNDFEFPPWAKNNYDFIRKHRKCLESQYTTEELHNWLDLIFGYKQTGREAANNLNIFFSVSYEEDFAKACSDGLDDFIKKGMIEQAYHFGQTPAKLFLKPHVQKKYIAPTKVSVFEKYLQKTKMDEEKKSKKAVKTGVVEQEVKTTIKIDEVGRIFALIPTSGYLLAVKWDNKYDKYYLLKVKWESSMEFGQRHESTELEGFSIFSCENWLEYQSWKSTLPKIDIKMVLDIGQYQFCIWEDKYLVSAFHTDNTFKFNSLKGELKKSVKYHCGLVTCVHSTVCTLFTGSLDSSVISWIGEDLNIKIWNVYLGHNSSIRQIQASENFQIVLSLSANGIILMHDIRNAELLRKITEPDNLPARVMALSEIGIIAVAYMEKEVTVIYTINGESWSDSRPGAEDVWCMQFDKTGEYLLTGSNKSIAFLDVFDGGNGLENLMYQSVENTVLAVCISKDEEFITFVINKESRTVINILRIQNKNDSLNTIKIIQQFA